MAANNSEDKMAATSTAAASQGYNWLTGTASSYMTVATMTDIIVKDFYLILGSLGAIGNLFVVLILTCFSVNFKNKITNILIVNQSVVDMLASVMMILTAATDYLNTQTYTDSPYDRFVCRVWLSRYPLWGLMVSSTYSIVALSVERYIAIVFPIFYKTKIVGSRYAVYLLAIVSVLIGLLFQVSWSVSSTDIVDGVCYPLGVWNVSETARKVVGVVIFVVQYVIPVFLMTFCYGNIFHVLNSKVAPSGSKATGKHDDPVTSGIGGGMYQKVKRNVLKTALIVCLGFVMCSTCNEFFILLFFLGHPTDFTSWFYHFTVLSVFANCCLNPLIYAIKYREFQHGVWLLKNRILVLFGRIQTKTGFGNSDISNVSNVTADSRW